MNRSLLRSRRSRAFVGLLAGLVLPNVGPMEGEALAQAPDVQRAILARGCKGSYVALSSRGFESRGIPAELRQKIEEYRGQNQKIRAVAFTPDCSGWTVVAGNTSFSRNVAGSDPNGYFATVNALHRQNKTITSVAFNPSNWSSATGYVITYEGGFVARGIPAELDTQLRRLAQGRTAQAVAFTPSGGWTVVSNRESFTRNVGGSSPSYFDVVNALQARGESIESVSFEPGASETSFALTTNRCWETSETALLPIPARNALNRLACAPVEPPPLALRQDNPTVVVLLHGKTSRPTDAPEENINGRSHFAHYFSHGFVSGLLGETFYTADGGQVTPARWEQWRVRQADPDEPLFIGSPTAGVPSLSVFMPYRDGTESLADQTIRAIDQTYERYLHYFGWSAKRPDIVFIGHSMGGLVTRALLSDSPVIGTKSLPASTLARARFLRDRTRYAITLATPHDGSPAADLSVTLGTRIDAEIDSLASVFSNKIVDELVKLGPSFIAKKQSMITTILDGIKAEVGAQIGHRLPATSELRPATMGAYNRGPRDPARAKRADGSLIPVYVLGGRLSEHDYFVYNTTLSDKDYTGIRRLGEDFMSSDPQRVRRAREAAGLSLIDTLLHVTKLQRAPSWGAASSLPSLDNVKRRYRVGPLVWRDGGTDEVWPIYYDKDARDGEIDADGLVSIASSLGLHLGRAAATAQDAYYFDVRNAYRVGNQDIRGSWYRIASGPWDFHHHGRIHREKTNAAWLKANLIGNAQVGPYARAVGRSSW